MNPSDFEKLGALYLGRTIGADKKPTDSATVLESKDLVTHAVCVGMTGSGKTGLCIDLLEEAALDGVPAIVIDPKGDLANLCLAFPQMQGTDVRPYVDDAEAARRGVTPEALAQTIADGWRAGWAATAQDGARVQRFKDAADVVVFTPGSSAGVPLAPLGALLPPPAARADDEARREHCATTAASLLSLADEDTAPTTPAHVLLSLILDDAAQKSEALDLPLLLRRVREPPFAQVGVLDIESFFPVKDRQALVVKLNAVLAAPSMSGWLKGTPLEAEALLTGPNGKPRISVIHVAHLSDGERMAFVTRLLGEVLAWTRAQRGTQSLRALLFIDEVMGYMPPVANPPSKLPLLTLMKQARAFGVGVVVATQNPVDLDYKALANAGTWLIGRMQTERDRARVLDGLDGSSLAADRGALDQLIASLEKRQFVLASAHRKEPTVFESRTTLSFLAGPLTRPQLAALKSAAASMAATAASAASVATAATAATAAPPATPATAATPATPATAATAAAATAATAATPATAARVIVEPGIDERIAPRDGAAALMPHLYAQARVRYVDTKSAIDSTVTLRLLAPIADSGVALDAAELLKDAPVDGSAGARAFAALPANAARKVTWDGWRDHVVAHIVSARPLALAACPSLGIVQAPGVSDDAFKASVVHAVREQRDAQVDKLKKKFQPKIDAIEARIARAEEKVRKEKSQVSSADLDTALSVGSTVLGALFGRKTFSRTNLGRAATSARKAARAAGQRSDVDAAEASLAELHEEAAALADDLRVEEERVMSEAPKLEAVKIAAKRAEVAVEQLALVWR